MSNQEGENESVAPTRLQATCCKEVEHQGLFSDIVCKIGLTGSHVLETISYTLSWKALMFSLCMPVQSFEGSFNFMSIHGFLQKSAAEETVQVI